MSEHWQNGLQAMNQNKPLAHLNKETRPIFARSVLNRYLDGEDMQDIAKEFGIKRARLYQIIVEGDSEAWREAQSAKALQAFEDTLQALHDASDGLELARARETHKSAQWQLEKLLRRLYGDDKAAISINAAGNVSIAVVSYDSGKNDAIDAEITHTIEHDPGPADSQE